MSLDINKISVKNSLTSCFGTALESINGGDEFLALLANNADEVHIDSHDYLLNEGESADYVFIPISGSVMLERTASNGARQVYAFLFTGNILGLSTSSIAKYNYSAKALSDLTAIRINRQVLEEFFKRALDIGKKYHTRTEVVLSAMLDHLFVMGQRTAHQRLAHFLLDMENRLFCHKGQYNLPMSRQDIADYLGMTVSTACRGFTALKKKGWISISSNSLIIINDRDAMTHYITD
ncbi:helix-turn-helix domain-containing protein [Thalassotalea psychrophila]|uniref:Helix-turn-helix domain-containing protein n=1 Tax=Thalassotalea psychrophila TaxID=3065647 RepID=A0ABY9TTX4_9GAMM|nr:helix-turn-helix domain-containing protein [Colwelliaceae bacterium SQ149]